MAGPWEKYQAAGDGPWKKYQAPKEEQWRRGSLAPVEVGPGGQMRLAVPQIAIDIGNAIMGPIRALSGEYDMEVDQETGRPTYISDKMIGDALGAASIPVLGGTGGPTIRAASGLQPALSGRARRIVVGGLEDAGIPTREAASRLEALGPDAVLADLAPQLQKQAQAIATMPGPGQDTVLSVLTARQAGRNQRIMGDVDEALGPAPVPSQVIAANKTNMEALRPQYEATFTDAMAVDNRPIAEHLDALIVNLRGEPQKAAQKVREMLNIYGVPTELDPNPRTLFETRQAIDGMLQTEQNGKVIAVLSEARDMVDYQLSRAVPGIKEVDAKFAELARQNEAIGTGQQFLDTGRTATRPSEFAEMMIAGSVPERGIGPSAVPFRLSQGGRAEIDRLIGTTVNDLNALKRAVGGDGNWNRDRLAAAFGPDKADELLRILEREVRFAETEAGALGGSRTQVLKAAQDQINGVEPKPGFVRNIMDFKPGSAVAAALDKGLGGVFSAQRAAANAAIADALMANAAKVQAQQLLYGAAPGRLLEAAPSAAVRAALLRKEAPWLSSPRPQGGW